MYPKLKKLKRKLTGWAWMAAGRGRRRGVDGGGAWTVVLRERGFEREGGGI